MEIPMFMALNVVLSLLPLVITARPLANVSVHHHVAYCVIQVMFVSHGDGQRTTTTR